MSVFVQKFLLFVVPIFLFLGGLEILSRKNDISSPAFQAKFLEANKDSLDGIAFGPSHLWRGLNPEHLDANVATFALFGSSPNVDIALCNKVLEHTQPKFIIFDLSQGYLQKHHTKDWMSSRKLGYYFGIGDSKVLKDYFLIDYPFLKHITTLRDEAPFTKHGFPNKFDAKRDLFKKLNYQETLIKENSAFKTILQRHNDINSKYVNEHIEAYKKIIEKAKSKNIKVIFVSTPKYHIYNNGLRSELIEQRKQLLDSVLDNEMVFFLDFERAFENDIHHFLDINHLNMKGSMVFTKKFNVLLNKQL